MTFTHDNTIRADGEATPALAEHNHPLRDMAAALVTEMRLRKARRELADLPPHLLQDIGLPDSFGHGLIDAHSFDHTADVTGAVR